jgi:hypothetical protein
MSRTSQKARSEVQVTHHTLDCHTLGAGQEDSRPASNLRSGTTRITCIQSPLIANAMGFHFLVKHDSPDSVFAYLTEGDAVISVRGSSY